MIRKIKKLLGMEKSHEQWLEEHPGKSSEKYVEAEVDHDEQDRIRDTMEKDLAQKREERGTE